MSVVLNTKKELFIRKRQFTAKKLSKKEFEEKVLIKKTGSHDSVFVKEKGQRAL